MYNFIQLQVLLDLRYNFYMIFPFLTPFSLSLVFSQAHTNRLGKKDTTQTFYFQVWISCSGDGSQPKKCISAIMIHSQPYCKSHMFSYSKELTFFFSIFHLGWKTNQSNISHRKLVKPVKQIQ